MNQDKIKDPIQNKLFIEKLKEIYKLLHNIQKLNTPDHSLAEIDENYIKPMIEFIKEFELFDEPEPYITIRSMVDDPNRYNHFIPEYTKIYYKDDPTQFVFTLMISNVDAFPLEHFYETIFNSINSQFNQLNKEEQFDDEFNQLLEKIQSIAKLKTINTNLANSVQDLKEQNTALQKEFINIQEQTDALLKNNKNLTNSKFKVEFANDIAKVFLKYLSKVITEEDEVKRKAIEELRRTKEANENWTDPHTEAFKNCPDKDCYPN